MYDLLQKMRVRENKMESSMAWTEFDTGPANAILITSVLGFLRFCSLN